MLTSIRNTKMIKTLIEMNYVTAIFLLPYSYGGWLCSITTGVEGGVRAKGGVLKKFAL